MFLEDSCERCGMCLVDCPYIEITNENAINEISSMIETRESGDILKRCIGCSYCNTVYPTQSNPRELIREITIKRTSKEGIPRFFIASDEIPYNETTIAMEIEPELKKNILNKYLNPPKTETMYFLGCALSYIQTDLLNTKILSDLPKIGGDKYCCGGYTKMFGEEEVKIKGRSLLQDFKELGVKKFILFCPGCLNMMKGVYSRLLPEYPENIEFQTFSQYFLERYHKGELNLTNKIKERITFHDPCAWRGLDKKVFEAPREFLEIIGAEVVEMKHNFKNSLCCGSPASAISKEFYKETSGMRISEAVEIDASIIAVSCTGCISLGKPSRERDIETYHLIELAQMAIGEKPPHRTNELRDDYHKLLEETLFENPDLLKDKVIIKKGRITRI